MRLLRWGRADRREKSSLKKVLLVFLFGVLAFSGITVIRYNLDIWEAYDRLHSYQVESFHSESGQVSYIDSGEGQAVLISYGIFGGYDQGIDSLISILGEDFRKIVPSRFGYPGSEFSFEPTPENQAKAFIEKASRKPTPLWGVIIIAFAPETRPPEAFPF